jgi:two-component system, NtrC family, response regulator HydG
MATEFAPRECSAVYKVTMPHDTFDAPGSPLRPSGGDDETTRLHGSFDPSPVPEPFVLTIIGGPDQGQSFALDGSQPSRILLGQAQACDIRLTDRTVSRRHVALDVEGGRVRVSDLGSKNGTRVDGVTIVEAFIQGGETLKIGSTQFRLDRHGSGSKVALSAAMNFGRTLGASTEMRRLYPLCERLAQSNVPVIIEGEQGTGKELLAECLHEQGPRANGPFVVLDCTAVPANLLEVELMGQVGRGTIEARPGVLEQAHGGTLLINEIAEMDQSLQTKLLRILEKQEVRRLGGDQPIKVDVRVLVVTRRDLDREAAAGRFRDELVHRLGVARIELPPLRRRKGDVMLLARQFAQDLGGNEQALRQAFQLGWEDHSWPGNVRELRSTVARHLALGELANLAVEEPSKNADPVSVDEIIEQALTLPLGEARQRIVLEFERRYVRHVLDRHSGNVTHAAESAGVARRYFQILKARVEKRRKEA